MCLKEWGGLRASFLIHTAVMFTAFCTEIGMSPSLPIVCHHFTEPSLWCGIAAADGYSTSRTCEMSLSNHSGIHFRGLVYLVDEATTAKQAAAK